MVEALVTHDGGGTAANLRRDRISPEMRRRIARHPDPAIRDGHADFVRRMVHREVGIHSGHESTGIQILARKPTAT